MSDVNFMLQVRNYSPPPSINNSIKVSGYQPYCMMSHWYGGFYYINLTPFMTFSSIGIWVYLLNITKNNIIVNSFCLSSNVDTFADGSWNWRLPPYWIWVQQKQVSDTFLYDQCFHFVFKRSRLRVFIILWQVLLSWNELCCCWLFFVCPLKYAKQCLMV